MRQAVVGILQLLHRSICGRTCVVASLQLLIAEAQPWKGFVQVLDGLVVLFVFQLPAFPTLFRLIAAFLFAAHLFFGVPVFFAILVIDLFPNVTAFDAFIHQLLVAVALRQHHGLADAGGF